MLDARRLLIDTNVWIDYFLGTALHAKAIESLFVEVERRGGALLYAPTSLKDVFFLIPHILRREAMAAGDHAEGASYESAAWACVRKMTEIAAAAPLSLAECDLAWMLRGTHGDLEDNLIIAAAETCGAEYVITYDKTLIEHFPEACVSPERMLELLAVTRSR